MVVIYQSPALLQHKRDEKTNAEKHGCGKCPSCGKFRIWLVCSGIEPPASVFNMASCPREAHNERRG